MFVQDDPALKLHWELNFSILHSAWMVRSLIPCMVVTSVAYALLGTPLAPKTNYTEGRMGAASPRGSGDKRVSDLSSSLPT